MPIPFKLLVLGTGTSAGVPMIGCDCAVCKSQDPLNHRLRSSAYISAGDLRILIDTSPDFREQALRADIRHIDAVFVTHAHVDHLFGLDDIRRINTVQGEIPMPLYASSSTLDDIRRIFDYIFKPNVPGTYRPKLDLRVFEEPISIPADEESDSSTPGCRREERPRRFRAANRDSPFSAPARTVAEERAASGRR